MPTDTRAKAILAKTIRLRKKCHFKKELINKVAYISFHLAGESFGIPYSMVKEVIGNCTVTSLTDQPSYVAGSLNYHGSLLTVIDLMKYLKLNYQHTRNTSQCIIVVKMNHCTLGFMVDDIAGDDAYELNYQNTAPLHSDNIDTNFIFGIHNGKTIILNIDIIVSDIKTQLAK